MTRGCGYENQVTILQYHSLCVYRFMVYEILNSMQRDILLFWCFVQIEAYFVRWWAFMILYNKVRDITTISCIIWKYRGNWICLSRLAWGMYTSMKVLAGALQQMHLCLEYSINRINEKLWLQGYNNFEFDENGNTS